MLLYLKLKAGRREDTGKDIKIFMDKAVGDASEDFDSRGAHITTL